MSNWIEWDFQLQFFLVRREAQTEHDFKARWQAKTGQGKKKIHLNINNQFSTAGSCLTKKKIESRSGRDAC